MATDAETDLQWLLGTRPQMMLQIRKRYEPVHYMVRADKLVRVETELGLIYVLSLPELQERLCIKIDSSGYDTDTWTEEDIP